MHAVQLSRWVLPGIVAAVLFGVILVLGYGIIGLAILFLLVCLGGGALMSYLGGD
ncbi:MAG TPA: hypothetical protein VHG91_19180 [Longimicrobium sp.]|nr:hypothetical protein [Longimicrobium sp.]